MAGILRDAEADAEGFIGGEERGPRGRDLSSRKQRRTIARKQFSDDKDRGEIPMGSPQRGAEHRWGRLKAAIFDQCLAASQKQCKIGIYSYNERIHRNYMLYRMMLFPITLSEYCTFCVAFHIFVIGGYKDFKFGA